MPLSSTQFSQLLLAWYDQHGRDELPWRKKISPYRVWLSEIMLQQTQVKTVLPYFQTFIQHFPNITTLANAKEDEVLQLWSGLGYYSRARNLHKTAKIIATVYKGRFPKELSELEKLPGIGHSTAGAILAIAYKKPAAILDGNVKRVLTRFHALMGWPGENSISKKLWAIAEKYTPTQRVDDYTQAIMDLGATICTRSQPKCCLCPMEHYCAAHAEKKETNYPTPKPSKVLPTRTICMLMILQPDQQSVLLEKRPPIGIWGSLWSLPECEIDVDLQHWCRQNYGIEVTLVESWPEIKHSFSHFHLIITPVKLAIKKWQSRVMASKPTNWHNLKEENTGGIAAPIKRLLVKLGETVQ
jgi:A/G-specific adenine glycosylase